MSPPRKAHHEGLPGNTFTAEVSRAHRRCHSDRHTGDGPHAFGIMYANPSQPANSQCELLPCSRDEAGV